MYLVGNAGCDPDYPPHKPVYVRRVDPSVLVFSLSLHRHPHTCIPFNSFYLLFIIKKILCLLMTLLTLNMKDSPLHPLSVRLLDPPVFLLVSHNTDTPIYILPLTLVLSTVINKELYETFTSRFNSLSLTTRHPFIPFLYIPPNSHFIRHNKTKGKKMSR